MRAPLVGVSVVIADVLMSLCGVCGSFVGRIGFCGSVLISFTSVAVSMTLDSSISNFLFLKFAEGLSNSVTVTDTPSTCLFLSTIDFDSPFALAFEIVVKEFNGWVLIAAALFEAAVEIFLFFTAEGMIVRCNKSKNKWKRVQCNARTMGASFAKARKPKLRLQK